MGPAHAVQFFLYRCAPPGPRSVRVRLWLKFIDARDQPLRHIYQLTSGRSFALAARSGEPLLTEGFDAPLQLGLCERRKTNKKEEEEERRRREKKKKKKKKEVTSESGPAKARKATNDTEERPGSSISSASGLRLNGSLLNEGRHRTAPRRTPASRQGKSRGATKIKTKQKSATAPRPFLIEKSFALCLSVCVCVCMCVCVCVCVCVCLTIECM